MRMSDEWFIRVEGKEYGPATLETLLEWKAEGRLIPQNEVRRAEDSWRSAAEVAELFGSAPPPLPTEDELLYRRRTFGEVITESWRIYARGFLQFFALALLIAIPSLGFKLSLAYVHYPPSGVVSVTTRIAGAVAVIMFAIILAMWPIFLAGLQFATQEIALGRRVRLRAILRRAVNFWPRIARLSLFVYGSYLFWTALPLLAILTLAATQSLLSIAVALLALGFQVYMAGRLFINFMFWQQSGTIGALDGVEALQDSRELARSRREAPALDRPLWRGALIASAWLLVLLAFSIAVELPFMMMRLRGITNFQDAYAMLQSVMNAPAPDAMAIASEVLSGVVHAALRPLLGIAFVVLYFDAKAR
jgi:hypothetical protein